MKIVRLVLALLLFAGTAAAAELKFAIYPMNDPQKLLPPMTILDDTLCDGFRKAMR